MTIQVFPEPSSGTSTGYSYYIPSTTSFPFDYSVGRGDRGLITYSYSVPKGIYQAFANATNGTIYVPAVGGDTGSTSAGNSGIAYPTVFKVLTSQTQFKVGVPTQWDNVNISLGTTMFSRFAIGGNNTGVFFTTLSTGASVYRIYASTNMSTWTEQTNPGGSANFGGNANALGSGTYYNPAAYGNGWFVVGCNDGSNRVLVSTNGFTWTTRAATGASNVLTVQFANGYFFANVGGGSAAFWISTDTVTWTSRGQGLSELMLGTAYNPINNTYVRVGANNSVVTSTNLLTWQTRALPAALTNDYVYSVAYGNGFFTAVHGTGNTLTSTDGITWTTARSGSGKMNNVIFNEGVHIAASQGASNTSLLVLGTSTGGSNSGFGTFDIQQTTAAGITWTGTHYVIPMTAQSGGSTSAPLTWSTSLPGRALTTFQGYFTNLGTTYVS